MLTYHAIKIPYLKRMGEMLSIPVHVDTSSGQMRIHIQDFEFYTFRDALYCLMRLAPDVLTDVTVEELAQMNQKGRNIYE